MEFDTNRHDVEKNRGIRTLIISGLRGSGVCLKFCIVFDCSCLNYIKLCIVVVLGILLEDFSNIYRIVIHPIVL